MEFSFITPSQKLECPVLWKEFDAADAVSAELKITGLGLYRAYLNGERVDDAYLMPGFNDYDAYLRYQTIDVLPMMKEHNTLRVYLGKGWYMGRFSLNKECYGIWGDRYLLAAELTWIDRAGQRHTLSTDESWLASTSCFVDNSIYDGESRDDTRVASKPVPCVLAKTNYNVVPWFSPAIRVKEELHPTLIRTPKNEWVLDFGQNFAGVFRFVNRSPRGAKIHIQTGEVLQQGCFYRDNLRSALSEYYYVSDGMEKTVEPFFTFYGFRYLRVEGMESVDPADFTGVVLSSDLKETLQVETGHAGLNQLMHNALWGQRSNFLDVPTDCPQRDERLGWTADTQVFVNTACYQMDCHDFYRKFMRDLRVDQTRYLHGDIAEYSPCLKQEKHGGAVWADAGTIIPWNVYQNYGDLALLKENYPMMKDYAEYLIAADRDLGYTHVVFNSHTFGDWLALDGKPGKSEGGTNNALIQGIYYLWSIGLTAKAAAQTGAEPDAERYAMLEKEIRSALIETWINPDGRLKERTQTAYILALLHGIWREKQILLDEFKNLLWENNCKIKAGFTGAPRLLPLLFDEGMDEEAYRILLNEEYPGWLFCVNLGATTIWERWNTLDAEGNVTDTSMNSLNHYAYGSVCEAIYSRVIGLRNAAPGWKQAIIHPHPNKALGHASIRYESVSGVWAANWAYTDDNHLRVGLTVPEGCTAKVELPGMEQVVSAGTYTWLCQP